MGVSIESLSPWAQRQVLQKLTAAEAQKKAARESKLQQQFTLQEAYTTTEGVRVRAIRYQADFTYQKPQFVDRDGEWIWGLVVEDVKSRATKTRAYAMKKKLMQERFNIEIQEV